jgi:hypothetical protein
MDHDEERRHGSHLPDQPPRRTLSEWVQTVLLAIATVAVFYVWGWMAWRIGSTMMSWIW